MTGEDVANRVWEVTEGLGRKWSKFGGAAAVEIVKECLAKEGISTSMRDAFIKGIPVEIDLIVPRPDAKPTLGGLLYEAMDVLAVLEIKKSGSYGQSSLRAIRDSFKLLRRKGLRCAYLTIEERQTYRHKATPKNLGVSSVYTLYWSLRSDPQFTRDWERLVSFLRKAVGGRAHHA